MSISNARILAAAPVTTRGQPTQLSADAKGQRIAYASGKSIFVRSIDDPADCREYTGHAAPTTVARFSPNGVKIASGDASGVLRVWEPDVMASGHEYAIIAGRLNDVGWDGDSQRLIAVGDGKERFGRCITADSGNSVGEVIGHSKSVNAVAMRLQRPLRAATVGDDGNVVFYHGAPYKFNDKTALHRGFVLGAAYSPDGEMLVTVGADKRIQLYDGKTGQPTETVGDGEHTGSIFAVSWSADGASFATASADQTVRLWDARARSLIQTWRLGDGVRNQQVGVVIPHGRSDGLIISINLDGELTYLVRGKPDAVRVLQGHNKAITALTPATDADSHALWTGSFDGRVCHWDLDAGVASVVDGEPHTNQIAQLAALRGTVYSAGWDDTLRLVDESSRAFRGETVPLPSQPKGVTVSSKGIVYVAAASGVASFSADGKPLKETTLGYAPGAVAAWGETLAVGGADNSVRIYAADGSGGLEEVKAVSNPSGAVSALAFSRDGSHLAAGNGVGKIYVYKTDSWELVADRWSAHTARVTCIAWDESGAYAASGSLDTNIFVWCLEKKHQGKRIKSANAHKDGVSGICWVRGGSLASAGGDATVKMWEVRDLP
ncbi:WD40 repeat-like-containing domain protein [Ophiocordyceps camponoti-floridani]|uniref:WD40 repeat-like-containing domain protein n=1 Tax=Ophiocordyceps camponoti-floridani TaxID=2030778 RepID=A0A8H4Q9S5_9HYPO|nr:WD40 repeat-like-containing domain protein [Ophiocordyceps camponoti-floridani]